VATVLVESRFCGPPGMSNGGYAAGVVARHTSGVARVRLQAPIPLDTPLDLAERGGGRVELRHDEAVLAYAEPSSLELETPEPPSYEEAVEASARSVAHVDHPFPGCFVCGTGRAPGEGLRLFSGPLRAGGPVATPWTPHPSLADGDGRVRAEFMAAALDCPGYLATCNDGTPMLLGEITLHVEERVRVREPCVVVGWRITATGRKHEVGTAVFDASGAVAGRARGIWLGPK